MAVESELNTRHSDLGAAATGVAASPAGASERLPGMKDVARVAGVSHQTVSRVLNGHPSVRDGTRARVMAAVERLGYRPNAAARALVTGRSRVIGLISQAGVFFGPSSMAASLQDAAHAAGYLVSVESVAEPTERQLSEAVSRLGAQAVCGIIMIATLDTPSSLWERVPERLPILAVEGAPEGRIGVVGVDQELGARLATEHLLGLGHRTVWHVSGRAGWYETAGRIAGWRSALKEAGADEPPMLAGDWTARSGYVAGQLLARMPEATAVFAANDQMALGVICALRERGRRIPEDVSIVGFDDIPEAAYYWPPLTTLRQDFREVGLLAIERLLSMLDDSAVSSERRFLVPSFVLRSSTAPPSA